MIYIYASIPATSVLKCIAVVHVLRNKVVIPQTSFTTSNFLYIDARFKINIDLEIIFYPKSNTII